MKRLVIISLDLLMALPILGVAFALLFSNITGSQSYLIALARFENKTLNLLVTSQQIASKVDANANNYSTALLLAQEITGASGVASDITNQSAVSSCGNPLTECRLVTVSGSSRLLVVYYENSN